jgi:hypothetical protein
VGDQPLEHAVEVARAHDRVEPAEVGHDVLDDAAAVAAGLDDLEVFVAPASRGTRPSWSSPSGTTSACAWSSTGSTSGTRPGRTSSWICSRRTKRAEVGFVLRG